ncbi:MAG TPA: LacI family DNA-binding transcriptional regulator [Solirubrobacteraceae bacterium]
MPPETTPTTPRQAVSLRALADATNLHPSTVSRILRGVDQRSSETTRARVLAAAQELGYRPNLAARSLRTRRSLAIGLVIPDLTDTLFASVHAGVERAARAEGYHSLLATVALDGSPGQDDLDFLIARGVDGILLAAARLHEPVLASLHAEGVPCVLINRRTVDGSPSVAADDEGGARAATEHLQELGHTRIGFIGGKRGVSTAEARLAGYRATMAAAALDVDERLIRGERFGTGPAREAAESLLALNDPPTAIVVVDDMMALAVQRVLRERGLRVPEDVSVTGFNDLPVAALAEPPLTTVATQPDRMGELGASVLLDHLAHGAELRSELIPATLVVRGSTAPPPRGWPAG